MAAERYTLEWRGFFYREDRGHSPLESTSQGAMSSSTRLLYCPWQQRVEFQRLIYGTCTLGDPVYETGGNAYRYPSRTIPMYHPDYLAKKVPALDVEGPWLFADSIPSIRPFLPPISKVSARPQTLSKRSAVTDEYGVGTPNYLEAALSVHYSDTPFVCIDDAVLTELLIKGGADYQPYKFDESSLLRFCQVMQKPVAKYQTIPKVSPLKWSYDNAALTTEHVFMLHEADVIVKWYHVPLELMTADQFKVHREMIGKTNINAFGSPLSIFGSWPAETLVMGTPGYEQVNRPNGEVALNVTFQFRFHPFGANKFYRFFPADYVSRGTVNGEDFNGSNYYYANRRGVPNSVATNEDLLFQRANYEDLFRLKV